jgi:hypothetical protein
MRARQPKAASLSGRSATRDGCPPRLPKTTLAAAGRSFSGISGQERWAAAEPALRPGSDWRLAVSGWLKHQGMISPGRRWEHNVVAGGLHPLVCADVIRPSLHWRLAVRTLRDLAAEMARSRDPGGFAALAAACNSDSTSPETRAAALRQIAVVMAAKGGMAADISVGDCLELLRAAGITRGRSEVG